MTKINMALYGLKNQYIELQKEYKEAYTVARILSQEKGIFTEKKYIYP